MSLSSPGIRLLVADDEEALRIALGEFLSQNGFEVETAGDGRQALALVLDNPHDLLLVDLYLPPWGAEGLLRRTLHRHPGMAGRFVIMTGEAVVANAVVLDGRAVPILQKPFGPDRILSLIRSLAQTSTR